ncbi:MAG TPA: divalent metal cation transporter, partial [Gammaproteobacteria bacterium]|nr:divalent metal cation transporter [Gammaproteobacteria bacterium]
MRTHLQRLWGNLGPGLLYAGAAVGVSHLVMSTKAGAKYEFLLLLLIPLIHLIKYPFYKFGPQYTALTGRNILHGYSALGKWALALYIGMTLLSMCLIQAAVTLVASSIAVTFFGLSIPAEYMPHLPAILLLMVAAMILYIGQYSLLDKVMKGVIIVLALTTLASLALVFMEASGVPKARPEFSLTNYADLMFLAAFLGWMPAPMDVSVWHSVWSEESQSAENKKVLDKVQDNDTMKKAMLDFKVGFFGTALLAMAFLSLGALVMFGNGSTPSNNGAVFAGQIIRLYTESLG